MYKKLLFITVAGLLVSHKSIVGMQIALDETQKQDFLQAASRLALEPIDKRNCELALLLSELQYENGNSPLHFAANIGDMPLAFYLLATGADKDKVNLRR